MTAPNKTETAPERVFIIPYRDRAKDKELFIKNMTDLLGEDDPNNLAGVEGLVSLAGRAHFFFAHQCDHRPFNRGAMKNIGFLAVRSKYPNDYKNITFIFHDVDTWPSKKGMIDYTTTAGIVKHYYGYKFALGGMFAIKGADFEKSGGFPNFWGWGIEDNLMNDRCLATGLTIDRSNFYDINDTSIIRTFDGFSRIISKRDSLVYKHETPDDLNALKNINFRFMNELGNKNIIMIQITNFQCSMNPHEQQYKPIDIRKTKKLIVPKAYEFRRGWKMFKS